MSQHFSDHNQCFPSATPLVFPDTRMLTDSVCSWILLSFHLIFLNIILQNPQKLMLNDIITNQKEERSCKTVKYELIELNSFPALGVWSTLINGGFSWQGSLWHRAAAQGWWRVSGVMPAGRTAPLFPLLRPPSDRKSVRAQPHYTGAH